MKKLLLVILSAIVLIGRVNAVTSDDEKINLSDYQTLNFKEILKEEDIKEDFKSYSEDDKQITIYMFRGNGCGYCRNFLTFLNSITNEYGKYFKVVGFEVWSNEDNSKLLDKVSSFMGSEAGGVPYIIIGDKVFPGYAESYDEDIKTAIKELYDSEEKYDVFEEYNKAIDKAKKQASGNAGTIIFWNFVFIAAGVGVILYDNKKKYNNLLSKLETKSSRKEEVKEEKKEVKKVNNAKKKKK